MASINPGYALPSMVRRVSPAAGAIRAADITISPSTYELPTKSRSVIDQGQLTACVSCALASAMEILNPSWSALSPLFHYHVTRFEDNGANSDGFLFLDNGLATLTVSGICLGSLHPVPFTSNGAGTKPSEAARTDAHSRALGRRRLLLRYREVDVPSKVVWIRDQLRAGCPVIIGTQLPIGYPHSFLNSQYEWVDHQAQRSTTGHCLLVTGFNDIRQVLHIQDCAGPRTFDKGSWWMGYKVADSSFVQQVYCLDP